ncbi:hypothetical protein PoB_002733400 [Plakobranchus ocellatus]|uniref:Uncharacterized protein n=1 Tax=Plakobranchus ocellatus TaxID=259542 RepID=A0AAV3ZZR0_9GAST|nr:hypothetical protein PoB_002733400 [Plakobranchus ocellatus]
MVVIFTEHPFVLPDQTSKLVVPRVQSIVPDTACTQWSIASPGNITSARIYLRTDLPLMDVLMGVLPIFGVVRS